MKSLLVCILMLVSAPAMAGVEVSLPLDGYWRPGKYMPVKVEAKDAGEVLEIGGEGVVPVRITTVGGRFSGVVPMLVMSEPRGLREKPMRQVGMNERLVGFTTIDLPAAQKLFPGETIIPIQLPGGDPLPGVGAAWDTLDAVVLDREIFPVKKEEQLAACGIIIAVRGAPASPAVPVVGPRISADDLAPFAPVQGKTAEPPKSVRRQVMLCAVIFAIVLLGASLLRFRYSAIVLVALCGAATMLLSAGWKEQKSIEQQMEHVIVRRGTELMQYDEWFYLLSTTNAQSSLPWRAQRGVTRPYFETTEDRIASKLVLEFYRSDEPLSFTFQMRPGQKIAFLSRYFWKDELSQVQLEPAIAGMELLAKRMYLRPGVSIAGQVKPKDPNDTIYMRPPLILKLQP